MNYPKLHSCDDKPIAQFKYSETLVTREFYNSFRDHWKQSKRLLPYFRLLDYLLSGDMFDEESDLLMLPYELCSSMRNGQKPSNSFSTKGFVERFSDLFFPVRLVPHKPNSKVVQVESMDAPVWLTQAWDDLQRAPRSSRNISFVSGADVDLGVRRAAKLEHVLQSAPAPKHEKAKQVMDYMNGLNSDHFEPILRHWDEAYDLALQIPEERSRKHQLAILNRIKIDPQPIYKPVEHTARIYWDGASFLGLSSELRSVLTQDWVKIDLKQAQLNIVSSVWGVPAIQAYVSQTPSGFWNDVCKSISVCPKVAKPGIKEATYSVIFGSAKNKVVKRLTKYIPEEKANQFLQHRVISILFSARTVTKKALKLAGSLKDAFGIEYFLDSWKPGAKPDDKVRSLLSSQAQSYELAILYPAMRYAISTQNSSSPLIVTGWLHDGIWVDCDDKEALSSHVQFIENLIRVESTTLLGFAIEPDVEFPGISVDVPLAA